MSILFNIIFLFASYIIGSIPVSLIFGKAFKKIDLRQHGSGNLGTTNAIRVLGAKLGGIVFVFDVLKAIVVLLLIKSNLIQIKDVNFIHPVFFGLAGVIGHCYSPFVKFKGGKAVACSLGVVLCMVPIPAAIGLVAFIITLFTFGYVSLGSMVAAVTVLIGTTIQYALYGFDWFVYPICVVLVILIIYKHKKNIIAIINGTERTIKKKNKTAN